MNIVKGRRPGRAYHLRRQCKCGKSLCQCCTARWKQALKKRPRQKNGIWG